MTEQNDDELATTVGRYNDLFPKYQRLVTEVVELTRDRVGNRSAIVSGRAKTPASFKGKIQRKTYADPLAEITDLAGVRVVCSYVSELSEIQKEIESLFDVTEVDNKIEGLGADKMGYASVHMLARMGSKYSGGRYEGITSLTFEIQVRTILQDAWATISHGLAYKNEQSIPERLRRDLNSVSVLLEIAQGVFDSVRSKQIEYVQEIEKIAQAVSNNLDFLSQKIDYETLMAYSKWRYPNLPANGGLTTILLRDLDRSKYQTLGDIDDVVEQAEAAVKRYLSDRPEWFKAGTDYLTKSLGFADPDFRARHGFAKATRAAFDKYSDLMKAGSTS